MTPPTVHDIIKYAIATIKAIFELEPVDTKLKI